MNKAWALYATKVYAAKRLKAKAAYACQSVCFNVASTAVQW
jgi:hypothetical protein